MASLSAITTGEDVRARTEDVLETLYLLHYDRLLRFAWLLTRGRGAEDLVQEAFVRALRRWDRDAAPEAFGAWAQTTLLRLHLSALRRARREFAALQRAGGEPTAGSGAEPVPEVARALDSLSPRQRAAVVLRYFEDLPEADVADRLGCRLGTAKALLHQARTRLQLEPALR